MSSSVVKRTDKDILLGVALHTTKSAHSRIAYSTETVALSLSRKASKRKLDKDVDPSTEEAKWYENKLKQAKEKSITPEMNIDTLLQKLQTNLKDSTRIDENGSIGYRIENNRKSQTTSVLPKKMPSEYPPTPPRTPEAVRTFALSSVLRKTNPIS